VLGNSESVLFSQQLYIIVAAQLISSSLFVTFSQISQQPRRFRKIQAQEFFLVAHG